MAYSSVKDSPAFRRGMVLIWLKRLLRFALTEGIICAIAFGSRYFSFKAALAIALVSGVLLIWATGLYRLIDFGWEGEVVDKLGCYTEHKTLKMMLDRGHQPPRDKDGKTQPYVKSILKVKRLKDGRIITHTYVENEISPKVDYYRLGDRVRHHARLPLYEKEDKSHDRWIFCPGCETIQFKEDDRCKKCRLPLLK